MTLHQKITMEKYSAELLDSGMSKPQIVLSEEWRFYRPMSHAAFGVNLSDCNGGLMVVCGFALADFDAGDDRAEFFEKFGIPNGEMKLREGFLISDKSDEESARQAIAKLYAEYCSATKDDLIAAAKERRKEFTAPISARLKPLGFKKKGTTWTRALESDCTLMFDMQKSSFSDEYYFNVFVGKNGLNSYGDCFYRRVSPNGKSPVDWQLVSEAQMEHFLDDELCPLLSRLIETPPSEMKKL